MRRKSDERREKNLSHPPPFLLSVNKEVKRENETEKREE